MVGGGLATEICTLTSHAAHPTPTIPGVFGNLGSRLAPPGVRETKAGRRPPESRRREARSGKPRARVSLEPNSSPATESHGSRSPEPVPRLSSFGPGQIIEQTV